MGEEYRGWYSKQAVEAGLGTAFYSVPSEEGKEVEVVAIYPITKKPDFKWTDVEDRGPVQRWQRHGVRPGLKNSSKKKSSRSKKSSR